MSGLDLPSFHRFSRAIFETVELESLVEKQEGQARGLFIKNNFSVSL